MDRGGFSVIRLGLAAKGEIVEQADVIGVDIEFRKPEVEFDGVTWRGHDIHFPHPEDVDNRGRYLRISGWYQVDNPSA